MYTPLKSKNKYPFVRNQENMSEWMTCLFVCCCFRGLPIYKSNLACCSSTKRTSSSSYWKLTCSRHDIAENCRVDVTQ